jgi:hypothetical protein
MQALFPDSLTLATETFQEPLPGVDPPQFHD